MSYFFTFILLIFCITAQVDEISFAKEFYFKRLGRLMPVYYICMVIGLWQGKYVSLDTDERDKDLAFILSWFNVATYAGLLPINGPLWTLSVICFYYICFPWILTILQKVTRLKLWLVVHFVLSIASFLLCWHLYEIYWPGYGNAYIFARGFPPGRISVFVVGILIGLKRSSMMAGSKSETNDAVVVQASQRAGRLADIIGLSLIVLYCLCIWISPVYDLAQIVRVTIEVGLTLPFALWLYLLSTPEIEAHCFLVSHFLNLSVMQKLGEFSFAMYGLHMPIGVYLTFAVYGTGDEKPPYWFILPMLSVSIFCSWLFNIVVDKPIQRYIVANSDGSNTEAIQTGNAVGSLHEALVHVPVIS